jgi:penicillin amidase
MQLIFLLICDVPLFGAAFGLIAASDHGQAPLEELTLAGLDHPVEILHDRWGVAHIYAQNEHDLFLAQGFNVARDRLFQLELWRRQATGLLAEIQGPKALGHDLGARLLRFRGDISHELSRYHARGSQIITDFVQGINAYIALTEREQERLPVEFRVLGITPGRWSPEIVVSRHNGLYRNVSQEVRTARLVHVMGGDRARELLNLHPGRPHLEPDAALDLALVRENVLELYRSSRRAPPFQIADVQPAYRNREQKAASLDPGNTMLPQTAELSWTEDFAQGSNNWVIASSHAFSGSPIMANDPHRVVQVPSLRYWVHLIAPGWNVIGAGEPALPGVSIGHNEQGAWGFTIFAVDQEDLYVYATDPEDPSRYRYQGTWETMGTVHETIPVKGQAAVEAALKFTRHGPVIHEDHAAHRAFALRAAWLEEGTAPYLASLRIDQARSWSEFREACRSFLAPSENLVWADVEGHIGWQAAGLAPIRENWNGLLPVPGDGRYEWTGFLPVLDLPFLADPPQGWLATANQDNLPRDYRFAVGFQWTDPFRFARIAEVLESSRRFTLPDMVRLQQDELSVPARSLVPLLLKQKDLKGKTKRALEYLASWNHVLDRASVSAAIYVAWEKALKARLWKIVVPKDAQAAFPASALSTELIIRWLTVPDRHLGLAPIAARDALLCGALDQALDDLERRLGPETDQWRYGQPRLKHVSLRHPLSQAVGPDLQRRLDLGPLPRGGAAHTVNSTSDDDNQSAGASFRIIANASDWDQSVGTNTPGQSGDPDSPHYRDLFEPWAQGRYFSVPYSRDKVESLTESRTLLKPSSRTGQ